LAQALERSIAKDDARAWLKIEALHYLGIAEGSGKRNGNDKKVFAKPQIDKLMLHSSYTIFASVR
jgi:hypothetical protein